MKGALWRIWNYGAQLDTATDSLSPPERGEGWGEGI